MTQSLRCDHFQAFSNMEETRPGLHTVVFFVFCFCFPPLSFMEDQTLPSQASRDLKLIFSPLLMNAKISHHVT